MHKIYVKSNQIENSHLKGENGQLCAQFSVKSDSIIYSIFLHSNNNFCMRTLMYGRMEIMCYKLHAERDSRSICYAYVK